MAARSCRTIQEAESHKSGVRVASIGRQSHQLGKRQSRSFPWLLSLINEVAVAVLLDAKVKEPENGQTARRSATTEPVKYPAKKRASRGGTALPIMRATGSSSFCG